MKLGVWLAAFGCLTAPAVAANLDVSVVGVRSDKGSIAVAVCGKPSFPGGACPHHAEAPARVGVVTVRVSVPAGTWAAAVYHDEANVKHLDYTLLGVPRQGVGFSRDALMRFGPPDFADAAFRVGDGPIGITVSLRYPH